MHESETLLLMLNFVCRKKIEASTCKSQKMKDFGSGASCLGKVIVS